MVLNNLKDMIVASDPVSINDLAGITTTLTSASASASA